jgi:hypothetical protein
MAWVCLFFFFSLMIWVGLCLWAWSFLFCGNGWVWVFTRSGQKLRLGSYIVQSIQNQKITGYFCGVG